MANLNKVLLMGNLTRDPELRYTPSGTAVCEFGIAINRKWKTADGDEREETCFVDCSMFGRRGEVVAEYFKKGRPIFVEGRLQFDQWESREGQKRSKLKVMVENFEFLGSGDGERGGRQGQARRDPPPGTGQTRQPPPERRPPGQPEAPAGDGGHAIDDEIPF